MSAPKPSDGRRYDARSHPTTWQIGEARRIVDRAKRTVVDPVQAALDDHDGVLAQVEVRTFLVCAIIAAQQGGPLHVRRIHNVMLSLPLKTQRQLFIIDDDGHIITYRQLTHFFVRFRRMVASMNADVEDLDDPAFAGWVASALIQAARPTDLGAPTRDKAIDGTDIETWARTEFREEGGKTLAGTPTDPTAGPGHRPFRNGRAGGGQMGYELHILEDIPDATGDDVPRFIADMALTPGGTNRGAAVRRMLTRHTAEWSIRDLVNDKGYSGLTAANWSDMLDDLRIGQQVDLMDYQGRPSVFQGAWVVDAWLFSPGTPPELLNLPRHHPGASAEEREALAKLYDRRAQYAYRVKGAINWTTRTIRLVAPCRVGAVACPLVESFRRLSTDKPLIIEPPAEPDVCCTQSTMTVPLAVLGPARQSRVLYGTTEWLRAYHRRSLIESANSLLKTHYTNFRRGTIRVREGVGIALLLACALAALVIEQARAYRERHGLAQPEPCEVAESYRRNPEWKPTRTARRTDGPPPAS